MSDERREALSQAYDRMAAEPAPEPAPAPEPVAEAAPSPAPQDGAPPPASERPRDEAGRFVKTAEVGKPDPKPVELGKTPTAPEGAEKADTSKAAVAGPGKVDGAATPSVPSTDPVAPAVKAPVSWTPEARAEFAKAPPLVQREIAKREAEITRTLNETAQARQLAEGVQRAMAPYELLARTAGAPDVLTYAGSLLQTAAMLQQGSPTQKAAILAYLINTYSVDVEGVNHAMQNPQIAQQAMQQRQAPPVDPREEVRRILAEERIMSEAQAFLANPPEFYDTVRDDMHEILRLDRARGGNMPPQQAYERACKYSEEVQSIKAQRKAAEDAQAKAADMARAKAAAGSVRTTPASPPPPAASEDRLDVLRRRYEELERR